MSAPFRQLMVCSLLSLFALVACGDDVVDGSGDNTREASNDGECPAGYEYNPISENCQAVSNGETGNGETGNGETGNGETGNGETGNGETGNGETGNGETGNGETGECGPGAIEGQACRPDQTALSGAEVTVSGTDCETGESFSMTTTADSAGIYEFEDVPGGDHTVTIESGSFSGERDVTVYAGETAQLVAEGVKVCVAGDSVEIALIAGTYDDVGPLLDGMDIDYDVVGDDFASPFEPAPAQEFLNDLDAMSAYDIIFIECGNLWDNLEFDFMGGGSGSIEENLAQFVEDGGSLYTSDWAAPFINESMPGLINFVNESSGPSGARIGEVADDVEAQVVSPEMQLILPSGTTTLSFASGNWAVMESQQPSGTTTHFSGSPATNEGVHDDAALMVTTSYGTGRAIFTSFHNSAQASGEMQEILEFMIFQL